MDRRYRQKPDMFSEGSVGKLKSKYDTFKQQFMFECLRKRISHARENNQETKIPINTINHKTKEFLDNEPETNKNIILPLTNINLYGKDFHTMYRHFVLRADLKKELLTIEFRKSVRETDKGVRYYLFLFFKKIKEIISVPEKSMMVFVFESLKITKESQKKKQVGPEKYQIKDLSIFKDGNINFNKNYIGIQVDKQKSFAIIKNLKDLFRKCEIKIKEGPFSNKDTPKGPSLNLREVNNSKDLSEIKKFEKYVEEVDYAKNYEMLQKVKIPKITQKIKQGYFHCPIYTCFDQFKSVNGLRKHVGDNHKELLDNGMTISDHGKIEFKKDIIRKILMVCKIIPNFVKTTTKKHEQAIAKLDQLNKTN